MQIENFRMQPATSSTIAIFDIYFPNSSCTFRNFRLVKGKKGHFVCAPSFREEKDDGTVKYIPYVEYSPEKSREFFKKIYDTLKDTNLI